jgi:hypothetical protein
MPPSDKVAYLGAADILLRLLPCRLSDTNQPVISPQNRFSILIHAPWPASERTEPLHITIINRRHVLDRL